MGYSHTYRSAGLRKHGRELQEVLVQARDERVQVLLAQRRRELLLDCGAGAQPQKRKNNRGRGRVCERGARAGAGVLARVASYTTAAHPRRGRCPSPPARRDRTHGDGEQTLSRAHKRSSHAHVPHTCWRCTARGCRPTAARPRRAGPGTTLRQTFRRLCSGAPRRAGRGSAGTGCAWLPASADLRPRAPMPHDPRTRYKTRTRRQGISCVQSVGQATGQNERTGRQDAKLVRPHERGDEQVVEQEARNVLRIGFIKAPR